MKKSNQDLRYIFNIIWHIRKNCKREFDSYIADMRENGYVWKICLDTYNNTQQNVRTKLQKL